MASSQLLENLAAAIHDLWREGLSVEGWKHTREFSEKNRTHDAMAPFAELKPADRQAALRLAEIWAKKLVAEVDYPRGADRELTLAELYAGMPVGWSDRVRSEPADASRPDSDDEIGYVTDWTVAADGATVETIRVAWPDSSITEHFPVMRELRRVS